MVFTTFTLNAHILPWEFDQPCIFKIYNNICGSPQETTIHFKRFWGLMIYYSPHELENEKIKF